MSARYGLKTLQDAVLHLSSVQAWTDPYERWWCETLFRPNSKLVDVNAFGTCWTMRRRSESFWRLYEDRCSHVDENGTALPKSDPPIRLKVNVAGLVAAFAMAVSEGHAKVYIGRVRYRKADEIVQHATNLIEQSKEVSLGAASALMVKRLAFQFEQEVRALWIDRGGKREFHTIPFRPAELIQQVMVGPCTDLRIAESLKAKVRGFVGSIEVKRSLIYKAPPALH